MTLFQPARRAHPSRQKDNINDSQEIQKSDNKRPERRKAKSHHGRVNPKSPQPPWDPGPHLLIQGRDASQNNRSMNPTRRSFTPRPNILMHPPGPAIHAARWRINQNMSCIDDFQRSRLRVRAAAIALLLPSIRYVSKYLPCSRAQSDTCGYPGITRIYLSRERERT
ncbi:hypothetical protein BDZ45DRAFT_243006 [Acephala macrosclerotiorum]|nr:hypothetical protein BDZ45DRAFT_243006 [Acephala macrosclerotiorum]